MVLKHVYSEGDEPLYYDYLIFHPLNYKYLLFYDTVFSGREYLLQISTGFHQISYSAAGEEYKVNFEINFNISPTIDYFELKETALSLYLAGNTTQASIRVWIAKCQMCVSEFIVKVADWLDGLEEDLAATLLGQIAAIQQILNQVLALL